MTLFSVNINKAATLRNSRGKNTPNLMSLTKHLINLGVKGITIHPRPDERHIKRSDVYELNKLLINHKDIEFNIEGYPSDSFLELIKEIKPQQCTLVPDPPHVLTSNAGWDLIKETELLNKTITFLNKCDIRCSLFIDPMSFNDEQFLNLKQIGPGRVELYTESYADDFNTNKQQSTVEKYAFWAKKINDIGIRINAGHDLNQENLTHFLKKIPEVSEVSIGHAVFCEAIYNGFDSTINNYMKICNR